MRDMSKFYFMLNGYSIKELRKIDYDTPEDKFTQSETDIYGNHENNFTPGSKIVFTLTVPTGMGDETVLDGFYNGAVEGAGTYIDKRGKNVNTIAFDKAVVSKKTKSIDRSTDTAEYTILAAVVTSTTF